ncbi:MAG: hypothetical protein NTV21_18790 [Planctomycetota bacterium]|nr:hypothetical protein [Planctomycetota bacterium]
MSLGRYFLHDFFTAQEFNLLDERLRRQFRRRQEENRQRAEEIAELRADFERLALLTRSLAELCLEKGVLTKDELKTRMFELDLADDNQDGRLDPRKTGLDPKGLESS